MTSTWEPQNNKTCQILKAAEDGGYGVVAPIAYNIEHILAFAIKFSSGLLIHAAAYAARNASVPIAIHLDHAQDEAII
ncbi:hypothetical protein H9Q73_004588 [Fusarium xylarioides]|nr:hypothetical protein H9Q73_004588 [Fusarium xylarioides]